MHLRTRRLSFCIDFMCHKCLELLLSPTNHEKGRHVKQVQLDCKVSEAQDIMARHVQTIAKPLLISRVPYQKYKNVEEVERKK